MTPALARVTAAVLAGVFLVSAGATFSFAQAKPPKSFEPQPPPKLDALVIKLIGAERGKFFGNDVLIVSGIEPLSGKQRTFAVENERPENPNAPIKYAPRENIKSEISKVKPGGYLRIEPKLMKDGKEWIDNAEPYTVAEHEEEPNTFILRTTFEEEVQGNKVQKIELIKFGRIFDCYAAMVKDGKTMVPDADIVTTVQALKDKDLVEASLTPQGKYFFVTSLDPYVAARKATFKKLTETDVDGVMAPAAELDEGGTAVTVPLPGKLNGKRWVADATTLASVKRLKPGTAVLFKTRDVQQKQYLRSIAAAPKEAPAKKDAKGGKDSIMNEK